MTFTTAFKLPVEFTVHRCSLFIKTLQNPFTFQALATFQGRQIASTET